MHVREILKEQYADYLRERIYGALTLLAVNSGLLLEVEVTKTSHAFLVVSLTTVGLWAASLFAEYISYKVAHGKLMSMEDAQRALIVHRGILSAATPSLLLIILAWLGSIELHTALIASVALESFGLLFIIFRSAQTTFASFKMVIISIVVQVCIVLAIIGVKFLVH